MPDPAVSPVERLGVDAVQHLHASGEIGSRSFDEQVVMVVHQTIRMTDPSESIDHAPKRLQEAVAILIVEEDLLPSVPPAGDVIDCALKLNAKWTCHGKSITQVRERNKVLPLLRKQLSEIWVFFPYCVTQYGLEESCFGFPWLLEVACVFSIHGPVVLALPNAVPSRQMPEVAATCLGDVHRLMRNHPDKAGQQQ